MVRAIVIALAGLFAGGQAFRSKRRSGLVTSLRKAAEKVGVQFLNPGDLLAEHWSVTFQPGTTDSEISKACNGHCTAVGHPDAGGLAFAVMSGAERLQELLEHAPKSLEIIQPDVQDSLYPDVPNPEESDASTMAAASWGLDHVGVSERPNTGKGVHVYVQDTGVRVSHQDFGGRAIATLDYSSGIEVDCRSSGGCAKDGDGHGTHCAGTVGGTTYGVASGATIHAVKTLSDTGSGQRWWQISAIEWITLNGLKPTVISMSLGASGVDPNYNRVIAAATAKGVTVVVAAGNFGDETCSYVPASVPEAITVGALVDSDRATYSNYGSCNDMFAPGTAVVSATHSMNFGSAKKTGTSMACPHVAGGAAIILGQFPFWNRDMVFSRMKEYGRKGLGALKGDDPDLSLWVGKNKGPGKPACPSFATRTKPNYWGDCECKSGICSKDGSGKKNCPTSYGVGGWSGNHFSWKCSDCKCY